MRRMDDKDVIKGNRILIIVCVLFILVGLLLPLLPMFLPTAEYEELMDKEIVIESVERVHQYRGRGSYRLTTEDGEKYNITGDFTGVNIYEALPSGKTMTIKYYKNRAAVIVVDGVTIVHYHNNKDDLWVLYALSGGCFVLAACGAGVVIWQINRNRKKQAERDQRIIKKYGSIKN